MISDKGTGTTTTVAGLAAGTYYFTVANEEGCVSPASVNVVINSQPVTPAVPEIDTIIQPTCNVSTGGVVLTGLPAADYLDSDTLSWRNHFFRLGNKHDH